MNTTSPTPKAIRWQTFVALVLVAALALSVGVALAPPIRTALHTVGAVMGLGDSVKSSDATDDHSGTPRYYTCGMHPWVILPHEGDCPICHMKLTPIDPEKFKGQVAIDPTVVQNIGVRTDEVITGPLTRTIQTVGSVDYDETSVRDVNIKVAGWIEKLDVDYVGARVEEGQPLFELYSPQLYAAQEEYLLALKNPNNADLLSAARTRLEYFDITPEQIAQLEKEGKPAKTMTIRNPHSGFVIAKHANEGMKVDPGMQVFRIADLSRVWVIVTLYEYQLPFVELGMKATMTLSYLPGKSFEGRVVYMYPYLENKTREAQVRLVFDNPDNTLKPGMFANIELHNTIAQDRTLAPREAVLDTGKRRVAFVSLGGGRFEPRDVKMGIENGDGMVEIIAGLKPGEKVVTSGQFLLDSEARVREALAKMIAGSTTDKKPNPDKPAMDMSALNHTNHTDHAQSQTQSPAGSQQPNSAKPKPYPIDYCLISGDKLGHMGPPVTIEYEGRTLIFCCDSCIESFREDPRGYLKKLDQAAANLGQSNPKNQPQSPTPTEVEH
ncbi:MAG: efflux RND transporter periplasmic adaptor subunit [Phycisphaera sp.]|nr:efflux RND transporter periplasmic adaptor subunit [Phycisphaera sp.]